MRRLARHLFTLRSAVSLLLCVAVCVLWVRSFRITDSFERYRIGPGSPPSVAELYGVGTGKGVLIYATVRLDEPTIQSWPTASTPWRWKHMPHPPSVPYKRKWSWVGFARWDVTIHPANGGGGVRGFQIPLWSLTLPLAIGSTRWLVWVRRWQRIRRRGRSGLCSRCGYDLRASPDRCPECGTAVAPTTS